MASLLDQQKLVNEKFSINVFEIYCVRDKYFPPSGANKDEGK